MHLVVGAVRALLQRVTVNFATINPSHSFIFEAE